MNEKILVVDDEQEIADLVSLYLKNEGYTVFPCTLGAEALACVEREELSLAILDVMLPDMTGFDLCRRIREKHMFPIVMLTAKVEDMDKITGLTLGADDYMTKPFNPLELVARVKTQLRRYTTYNAAAENQKQVYDFAGLYICRDSRKCSLYGRGCPLRPWSLTFSGTCVRTGGRWSPRRCCLRRCGERNIWTITTPSWPTSPGSGRRWGSPAGSPGSSKPSGGWVIPLSDPKIRGRTSRLTRRLLGQYLLAVAGFLVALGVGSMLAQRICSLFIWQETDPLYQVLSFVKNYLLVFLGGAVLLGWAWITYRFLSRPLRYLDQVAAAAAKLAHPSEEPILLPEDLGETEYELNQVRLRALRDARAARDAEQRKNDLIVYLAHDLKTPLTSVIGYLTLLQDEPQISPELRAKYTGIALHKAQRLEELINEFFDITRFSLSHLALSKQEVNLSRMLEQLTYEFQPLLVEKELSWTLELAPNVRVLCDPDKLERVFDNLFRNAVHYSYGQTAIAVRLEQTGTQVAVRVENRGKTIPPEKLGQIFEQFFRLDSARGTTTGGAGLGLAIAKEIVELHGGTISAESQDERIAFTVRLPLAFQKNV